MNPHPHRIVLGVTGGIAAYKAPEIVRRWRERRVELRCVLTPTAARFVAPKALEVVTGHRIYGEEYLEPDGGGVEQHIELTEWADAMVVAPATAHSLAQAALGLAPNFLTTALLAWSGPLFFAPAMHPRMWEQPATQTNIQRLRDRGAILLGPEVGPLASGEVGMGRMVDPVDLVDRVERHLLRDALWRGRRVLVTAGPTQEPVDAVRYLGNRSSGRMGFAIAAEAAARGAQVSLVAGPVALSTPTGVERIDVATAIDMQREVLARTPAAHAVFMTAAVADYRPAAPVASKRKKDEDRIESIALVENPDILASLVEVPGDRIVVGFAAETEDLAQRAAQKLERKGCDLLVANDVSRPDIGFGSDANEVLVARRDGESVLLSRRPKRAVASALLDMVAQMLKPVAAPSTAPSIGAL